MLAVAASLVSCRRRETVEGYADPVGPIHINFSCGAPITIGLADANGTPAWTFKTKKKDPISWEVPTNVTINSITAKTSADPLPLDPDGPQGGAPGVPFKSKVKDSNKPEKDYLYKIEATCHTTTGADVRLVLDPEMIVR
jgi:hypothetical protein